MSDAPTTKAKPAKPAKSDDEDAQPDTEGAHYVPPPALPDPEEHRYEVEPNDDPASALPDPEEHRDDELPSYDDPYPATPDPEEHRGQVQTFTPPVNELVIEEPEPDEAT